MCSIVMPTDYEVLLSHSPPIFSQSYFGCRYPPQRSPTSIHRQFTPQSSISLLKLQNQPVRPCLVIRPEDTGNASSGDDEPTSPTRTKKKVIFADAKGLSLTQVRLVKERPTSPPRWNSQFLALVTQGLNTEIVETNNDLWEIMFSQPASNYIEFRKRLDEGKVSLENVIVKESESLVTGTVKVRNLSFHKQVIIRYSVNNWVSYSDVRCTYVPSATPSSITIVYDTFAFQISIPKNVIQVEFCFAYRTEEGEFWDNNNGKNYIIKKGIAPPRNSPLLEDNSISAKRYLDINHAKIDSWTEFASWTHLANDGPYW
uniref:Protein phosphatase 1 regulatory subunit n=1 Tax=Cacopsylla melanoneura TaxID=428564 RepID=A0A8D8WV43_9HEMI